MAFNGAGVFLINSAGQPVVSGTTITSVAFNALTADVATGLSTCITKDGQQTVTANIPFGGFKLTGIGAATVNGDALRYEQWRAAFAHICEFRLTGTTATPVPTADQTAIGTLYCTPKTGNLIALYDGSAGWNIRSSAEFSIPVPAVANTVHDVFCYDNAGVPTLELLAWTNDTTRATALTMQDGVYVKTGATTRRYMGTVRTNGANKVVDAQNARWLWNYYNRVRRPMRVIDTTASWTYQTAAWRQANAAAANQLDVVVGVDEDAVTAQVQSTVSSSVVNASTGVGVALDSTTAPSALTTTNTVALTGVAAARAATSSSIRVNTGVGRHYLAWLEYSDAVGTTTWYGGSLTAPFVASGITGEIFA